MAEDMTEVPRRISVSEDTLARHLAEMELRLRIYFDEQLRHKADSHDLLELARRIVILEQARVARDRGDFTDAQLLTLDQRVKYLATANSTEEWTSRGRAIAVLSVSIAVMMFILSAFLAIHGIYG